MPVLIHLRGVDEVGLVKLKDIKEELEATFDKFEVEWEKPTA